MRKAVLFTKAWDRAYRLRWDDVVYEPGVLEVVTYKKGKEWARASVKTTGRPQELLLEPETTSVIADGEDVCFVNVSLRDAQGLLVPRTRNRIVFAVDGPGVIVATDNGDETDFDDFRKPSRRVFNGRAQAIVRAIKGKSGPITVTASVDGIPTAKTVIAAKVE